MIVRDERLLAIPSDIQFYEAFTASEIRKYHAVGNAIEDQFSHPNPTGLVVSGRYGFGKIGEATVERFFEALHIRYKYLGGRNQPDFWVWFQGRKLLVDVKNSERFYGFTHHMLVAERHWKEIPCDLYVCTSMLNKVHCQIIGYCPKEVIRSKEPEHWPLDLLNRVIPISDLKPFEKMLKPLDRDEEDLADWPATRRPDPDELEIAIP